MFQSKRMSNLMNRLFCRTLRKEIPIRWLSIEFRFKSKQRYYGGSSRTLSFSKNKIEARYVEVHFSYSQNTFYPRFFNVISNFSQNTAGMILVS